MSKKESFDEIFGLACSSLGRLSVKHQALKQRVKAVQAMLTGEGVEGGPIDKRVELYIQQQRRLKVMDVYTEGDGTVMGMEIRGASVAKNSFVVHTTGAKLAYLSGELKIYQQFKTKRRLLSTITLDSKPVFELVERTDDHVLLYSDTMNIGIYGDSTCIISPKVNQPLKCEGPFKPDYIGRNKGELLLIDKFGGIEIYPQRHETGYGMKDAKLDKQDWAVDYELNAGNRVMIAAFPGRPFDMEKSFNSNMLVTSGNRDNLGEMPPDYVIREWSKNFDILTMFFYGLYKDAANADGSENPGGPYVVANPAELHRSVETAHDMGMKFCLFCSVFYYIRANGNLDGFYESVKALKDEFNTDGVYIDGLTLDHGGIKIDDKIGGWEMVRKLKQLFGKDGVVILHDSQLGDPIGTVPNIDANCDIVLNGEGIAWRSLEDDMIQYRILKQDISNTIALWKMGVRPVEISYRDCVDKLLAFGGRCYWGFYPFGGVWPTEISKNLQYYFDRLEEIKAANSA